jgi:hypothetical protein
MCDDFFAFRPRNRHPDTAIAAVGTASIRLPVLPRSGLPGGRIRSWAVGQRQSLDSAV